MTKLKRIQQDSDWVEGANFSFGIKPSTKNKNNESRSVRRESVIVHQTTWKSKYGRKSMAVNGFDLMMNSTTSSPISHRTRRKSMAVLPNRLVSKSKLETVSPKTKLQRPPISHKVAADEKFRKVNCDPFIVKTTASKSSSKARLSQAKLPRSESTTIKLNEQKKEKTESTSVKMQRNDGSTNLDLKKKHGKLKSSAIVMKPVKRLTSKTTSKTATPMKSPINNSRRLTRSARKKVQIIAKSPVLSNGNFRRTPIVICDKTQANVRNLASTSSPVSQNSSIDVPKVVSIARQKYNNATPITPKPEEPLKLIRQNMRNKVSDDMESAKEFVDSSFLVVKKTPHKFVEPKGVVLPSTPVSLSNLPPTPVSSRKSVLRSVRKRDSVRIEAKTNSENGECEMTSSILLEKPWSSTPVRKRTDEAESPYPDSNLINISELAHNSRDTDITDSFSESVTNGSSNDVEGVEELKSSNQLETGKRFCSLM